MSYNIPIREQFARVLGGCAAVLVLLAGVAIAEPALTDDAVTGAIEHEFVSDSAVDADAIRVTTSEGIVTLAGTADNILMKDRAGEIAETVKGVRAVVNRIDVKKSDLSRETIKRNVSQALLRDPATEAYEVQIAVSDNGVVTLTGKVGSWAEKRLCERVAMGARGVTDVKNHIAMVQKDDRSDAEIKPEIEKRLRWDVLVDHADIHVEVDDGDVTLTGTVGSAAEKRRARADAWVAGVSSVDDSGLKVAYWSRKATLREDKYVVKDDAEIEQAVKDALLYDPRVFSFNVDPSVNAGVVTLSGMVTNGKAKRAAENDARNTVGVIDVNNAIEVNPTSNISDDNVSGDVRTALLLDPFVDRYELNVKVNGGLVELNGTVDSYFEKMRAEDVALSTIGVIDVKNNLKVGHDPIMRQNPYVYPYWAYNSKAYPLDTRVVLAPKKSDAEILHEIRDELWWSPYVNEGDVDVTVKNGVARLTGTVDSWGEYNAARDNAYEGGAINVINNLKVD